MKCEGVIPPVWKDCPNGDALQYETLARDPIALCDPCAAEWRAGNDATLVEAVTS